MKNLKKTLVMCVSLALIAALAIGGTVAYLTLDPAGKSNIFTVGDISILLDEEVGTTGAAKVEKTDAGATYSNVMPGDYLKKEVSVTNTGANPAYVAVEVTFNNALAINKAIDEVYEGKDYNEAQIQSMYDYIFDGFGMNYSKLDANGAALGMRLTIAGDDMPEGVMQVDSVKTITDYVQVYSGNWFAEGDTIIKADGFKGYYSTGMDKYQLRYTYYMHLDPEQKVTLFKGFNVPASFNKAQLEMFEDMNIDIVATAIQADNFHGADEEAKAKNAFTALKKEYADGGNDGDIGDFYVVATAEDLATALAEGGNIKLADDIITENGFLLEDAEDIVLNLNGHTLTTTGEKAKLFSIGGDADLTIYGGKLVAQSTNGGPTGTSTGASTSVYFWSSGNLTMTDVEIEGSVRGGHRAIDVYSGNAVLTNVDITTSYGSGINAGSGNAAGTPAVVVLNNCDITVNGMYSAPYNSVCFSVMGAGAMTINSGNYKMINDATYATGNTHGGWVGIVMSSGGELTINGGTYTNVRTAGFNPQNERAVISADATIATVNLNGGTFIPQNNKVTEGSGTFNGDIINNGDGTYTVADLSGKTYVADGLYTDNAGDYYVYNAAGLQSMKNWMDSKSNNAFWGKTYNIMADIDATGVTWNTKFMSPDSTNFNGITFNGNGHTISNLVINGQGLFSGATKGGTSNVPSTFTNIKFDNVTVNGGTHHNGVVWGEAYGDITLDNVTVVNSKISGGCNVGALIGRNGEKASTIKFVNCTVKNTEVVATRVADYAGASAFLGMALEINGARSIELIFEGNNVSSGNTLTTADGMQGGGIYTAVVYENNWENPTVVNDFTNFNGN